MVLSEGSREGSIPRLICLLVDFNLPGLWTEDLQSYLAVNLQSFAKWTSPAWLLALSKHTSHIEKILLSRQAESQGSWVQTPVPQKKKKKKTRTEANLSYK
jgi:hypothetical protein